MALTKEQEQAIVEMYKTGVKAQQIATEFGISGKLMYGILEKNGVEKRYGTYRKSGEPKKKSKTKRCPVCKANNNPANAKFCCMCGADIRSETDILCERLDKAITSCCKFLPVTCVDEVTDAIRKAKQQIERAGK